MELQFKKVVATSMFSILKSVESLNRFLLANAQVKEKEELSRLSNCSVANMLSIVKKIKK